ncbi:MAG TPA: GntR family transcriptional regulator [Mycobacteriales bacterium]|nr:GntR family transcriptional regulator [Mycobacteriales bacterium]
MPALNHVSLPDAVRLTLRRRILNAEIPAGARLVETQLAAEFEVSRTTIRQALRDLQSEGLVELAPRRHCVVTRMDEKDATDVLYARYTLELGAVREWMQNRPPGFDDELRRELDAMQLAAENNDTLAAVEADTRFHGLLVAAGNRNRLDQLWHTLDGQMGALMRSSLERQHSDLADLAQRHVDLARIISSRDPEEIEAALREHYLA